MQVKTGVPGASRRVDFFCANGVMFGADQARRNKLAAWLAGWGGNLFRPPLRPPCHNG
jgi:hypothetical protein